MDQPYEVTARKYRPRTFSEVVGQEHITQTLQNALKTGQIAHAYLFAGPKGTGKTTTARLLAKALNCRSSDTMVTEPCGECESCRSITRGTSVDVMEIDGASNRGIDQIRDLREAVGYAAFEGRFKVYIIDEVHSLTPDAFNALLKTLEEPPSHVVFIFATTQPSKVMSTIMSRVQRYDFRRIGITAICETLKMVTEKEGITAEDEALHLIASKAEGALRDAESLLDQVRSYAGDTITLEAAREVLSVVDSERFFELTRFTAEADAAAVMGMAAAIIEDGQDPREFMLGYAEHLRYLMAASVGGVAALETLLEKEQKQYMESCELFGLEDYLRRLDLVSNAAQSLRDSPQPWIMLEATFLRLASMDRSVDLTALLDRIEGTLSGNPVSTVSSQPRRSDPKPQSDSSTTEGATATVSSADAGFPPTDIYESEMGEGRSGTGGGYRGKGERHSNTPEQAEAVSRHWNDIIEEVRRRKVTLGAFLAEAELKGIEENKLVLAFTGENHNFHVNMVNRHVDLIRESTREIVGHAYGVRCIKVEDRSGGGIDGGHKKHDLNQKLLDRMCQQDPNLKKIVDLFGARLEDDPGGRPGS